MSGPDITDRQREVLRTIEAYTALHGYAPGFRDLADELEVTSTNGVNDHIKALEEKGLLRRDFRVARSIRLTPAGKRVLQ